LRWAILSVAILAQVYLFVRIRNAILSSHRSVAVKTWTVRLAGVALGLLFLLNGYILFKPIPWVDPPAAVRIGVFHLSAVWTFGSLFSALLLLMTQAGATLGRLAVRLFSRSTPRATRDGLDLGRRRFLQAGVGGLAAAPVLLSGYGAAHASRPYDVRQLRLPFGRSLRVVQLTDIHAGVYMTRAEMRRYVDQVIALQPDLFVLTGDFISNSMAFLPGCAEEMARVRARYGTFATLGNHERWYGTVPEIRAVFLRNGIPVLNNEHMVIHAPDGPFALAGIDDLRAGTPDLDAALRGIGAGTPTLLLSHRPEIFPEAAARDIALTLSGHYHGGQVTLRLPGGDFSLAHMRTPYPEGLFRINNSHLYVSRGIGTTFTPVRLNAPPEVTLFRLE
jgi:predicted MPP superfamily phosphohydrolase